MSDSFKSRLITAMNANKIKAVELAKKTGLSKAQISQYTNGLYTPKLPALYKLAVALNVSEAWLAGQDVPMERGATEVAQNNLTLLDNIRLHFGGEIHDIVEIASTLNDQGQKRVVQYASDIAEVEKFKKSN